MSTGIVRVVFPSYFAKAGFAAVMISHRCLRSGPSATRAVPSEETLLEAAAQQPGNRDEKVADDLAWAIAGQETAAAFLRWLSAETDRMVRGFRFRRLVDALVPVLMERNVISGRAARYAFADAIERGSSVDQVR